MLDNILYVYYKQLEREREREREVTCNSKAQGCIALHHANLERIHAVVIMMMSIMPFFCDSYYFEECELKLLDT